MTRKYDPRHRVFLQSTPHFEVAAHHAATAGLSILTGVLSRETVARAREAVRAADATVTGTGLLDIAIELLEHPVALKFATLLLGPKVRLSNLTRLASATAMHADQGFVNPPWPAWPMTMTLIWAIDACTPENGAIRVMPDSGRYDHGPESDLDYPDAVPLTCPEGSIVVLSGNVWHQTGPTTAALAIKYTRPYILPEVDWRERISPERRNTLSPGLCEMLGFGSRATEHTATRHGEQIWLTTPALPLTRG